MVQGMDRELSNKICGRCNAPLVTTEHERVCSKCGVVWAERFADDTFDYDSDEFGKSARTGPPENRMITSGPVISTSGKDASGRYLKGEAKDMARRITVWDKRQKSNGKKTFIVANSEITRICDVLKINENIKQRGAAIFRECEKNKMMRGRTTTVFSAACLYAACREEGSSKTLTDFTNVCYARRSDISAYYRLIIKTLELKVNIMSPISYISRIGSNTVPPINVKTQQQAIQLLKSLNHKEGKDPVGLAAAALYYCCCLKGWDYTQRTIAIAAGITEVTIRNRIKDMTNQLKDVKTIGDSQSGWDEGDNNND